MLKLINKGSKWQSNVVLDRFKIISSCQNQFGMIIKCKLIKIRGVYKRGSHAIIKKSIIIWQQQKYVNTASEAEHKKVSATNAKKRES